MSLIITDIDADEYFGYEIVGLESEADIKPGRLESKFEPVDGAKHVFEDVYEAGNYLDQQCVICGFVRTVCLD